MEGGERMKTAKCGFQLARFDDSPALAQVNNIPCFFTWNSISGRLDTPEQRLGQMVPSGGPLRPCQRETMGFGPSRRIHTRGTRRLASENTKADNVRSGLHQLLTLGSVE